MTQTHHADNNQDQAYYDKLAKSKEAEWKRYTQPADGDFIILERFAHANMHYVYHQGTFRFCGEY